MIYASAFRRHDDEPGTRLCSGGCRRFVRVAAPPNTPGTPGRSGKPGAYSEALDVYGRTHYYCRECTERLWRDAS